MEQELLKRLDALAVKLGVTVEYLWAVLVKQATIEARVDIITALSALVFFTLATIIWRIALYRCHERDYDGCPPVPYIVAGGISLLGLLVSFLTSLDTIPRAVKALANPEYWAYKQLPF